MSRAVKKVGEHATKISRGWLPEAEGKACAKALGRNVHDGPRAQWAGKAGRTAAWGEEKVGELVTGGWGKGFGRFSKHDEKVLEGSE